MVASASGTVRLNGTDIADLPERQMRPLRRQLQMIYQDPYESLDLRVLDRHTGAQRLTQTGSPHVTLELADNPDYQAASVTVRTESLIAPPSWHDVDLASGEWQLRKQQLVPGYDPARYRTARIAVPRRTARRSRSRSPTGPGSAAMARPLPALWLRRVRGLLVA